MIENKYTSPTQSQRQRNIPASSLLNGISGVGPVVLGQSPNIMFPTIFDSPRKITTTGTATIDINQSDTIAGVSIYQSGSPVTTLQLPSVTGIYPIYDGSLNSGTYPLVVLPPTGLTILGQTSFRISFNGQSATFANDGSQIVVT